MDAYEKGETLGQGTFGVVYKAVHKEVRKKRRGSRMRRETGIVTERSKKETLNLDPDPLFLSKLLPPPTHTHKKKKKNEKRKKNSKKKNHLGRHRNDLQARLRLRARLGRLLVHR